MEFNEYQIMFEVEENHWWFKVQRNIAGVLLNKFMTRKGKVLDAGCGTGMNLVFLKKYGEVIGVDISDEAIRFCEKRELDVEKASVEKLPFDDNSFSLITSFEVIYHKGVKDDQLAINEFYRVCEKNGLLFLRVPAFNFLFGSHDKQVHGVRRYNKSELKLKVENAGFKVESLLYCNFFFFFPTLILRLLKRDLGDIKKTNKVLNKLYFFIFSLEKYILRHFTFPFGVSLICIARKSI